MSDEYIKFYFSDGWVHAYDNDACVMATVFGYRTFKDMQTGLLCVGFPKSVLSRVVNKLQRLSISYIFINYKRVFKDFKEENNYKLYLDSYIPRNNKVEIGDAVIIENANTKKCEKFVIVPSYIQKESSDKWGNVVVEQIQAPFDYHSVDKGEIEENSEVAKTLLQASKNKFVTLKNEDALEDIYLIKDIIKRDYYTNSASIR